MAVDGTWKLTVNTPMGAQESTKVCFDGRENGVERQARGKLVLLHGTHLLLIRR